MNGARVESVFSRLVMATDSEVVVTAEFNVGWTNHATTLDWDGLADAMADLEIGMIGLTEASNQKKTAAFTRRLGEQLGDDRNRFQLLMSKVGYDYAALIYDTERFVPPIDGKWYISRPGKYMRVELERTDDGVRFDATVAHLPWRKNRSQATDLLSNATRNGNVASIYLGDFNTSPSGLPLDIDAIPERGGHCAFNDDADAPMTSESGSSIDNFYSIPSPRHSAYRRRGYAGRSILPFEDADALDRMFGSNHYPVFANWNYHPTH